MFGIKYYPSGSPNKSANSSYKLSTDEINTYYVLENLANLLKD